MCSGCGARSVTQLWTAWQPWWLSPCPWMPMGTSGQPSLMPQTPFWLPLGWPALWGLALPVLPCRPVSFRHELQLGCSPAGCQAYWAAAGLQALACCSQESVMSRHASQRCIICARWGPQLLAPQQTQQTPFAPQRSRCTPGNRMLLCVTVQQQDKARVQTHGWPQRRQTSA